MNAAFTAMTLAQEAPPPPVNLNRFVEVIDRLIDVLARETQLLEQRLLKEIAPLQTEKTIASNDYVKLQTALQQNPAPVNQAPEEQRSLLREKMDALQSLISRNMLALASAVEAGERVFRVIKEAVQSKRAETGGYTATGAFSYGVSTPKHDKVSIAVNREI